MSSISKENIQLQMAELEMLLSMFPNKGELTLQDENIMHTIQRYLNDESENLLHNIEYSIAVTTDEPKGRINLQVVLPSDYPSAAPQLFARSEDLDRQQQLQLNKDLASYISSFESGELCICAAVQWLRDNSLPYLQNSKLYCQRLPDKKIVKTLFKRMWIYSHHIYRQELRKKIFDCAKKLNLTGFCLTGKPGIICVEGVKENCEEFWHVIRYPNWKHISCKHVESGEIEANGDDLRLFQTFEDLQFQAHGDYGLRNDYHMDLGQFLEFLKAHQSEHVFHILLGVEGKCSDS
ncbi:RWD domain-containing protein 2A [Pogona vitticeps]|nr:RWD domain-containing protein 2A isoform X2 [Pogona vitticeps]XP_020651451.1 RWD domain-containing protein 2A isoform X2 [Pogona vitticeps]XP_020651531.1 RWD domain-containing protein 2A isoform X2 [Pogona vitticeps]